MVVPKNKSANHTELHPEATVLLTESFNYHSEFLLFFNFMQQFSFVKLHGFVLYLSFVSFFINITILFINHRIVWIKGDL